MSAPFAPAWRHGRAAIYHGSADAVFAALPAESVHAVCCSPPYFNLRRYLPAGHADAALELGAERTPGEYVARLVGVLRAVRRALRSDGTLWLNVGDSYAGTHQTRATAADFDGRESVWRSEDNRPAVGGIPAKNLCLIPERLAIALQDDGWVVRQVVIWDKPACMPESVTDRCTTSHEYILVLAKSARYYFDPLAIAEPATMVGDMRHLRTDRTLADARLGVGGERGRTGTPQASTRNARTVWRLPPDPQGAARLDDGETVSHFAAFPIGLPTRAILASTSEKGCCGACGAPWRRVVERANATRLAPGGKLAALVAIGTGNDGNARMGDPRSVTTGWQPSCACDAGIVPCLVADPFTGSGTTALAALRLGRAFVGAELNPDYIKLAAQRIRGAASQTTIFDAGTEAAG